MKVLAKIKRYLKMFVKIVEIGLVYVKRFPFNQKKLPIKVEKLKLSFIDKS